MKILVISYAFSPNIGGIESVTELLTEEFVRAGHKVKLVTAEQRCDVKSRPFPIFRKPSIAELLRLYLWADVIWQNNISLSLLWPTFLMGKKCLVTTQTWLSGAKGKMTAVAFIKYAALLLCKNCAVSKSVAQTLHRTCTIVGNPYNSKVFRKNLAIVPNRNLLFVGRLVSDKGVTLLINALVLLRERGKLPNLTIVGEGPERATCELMVRNERLEKQVRFMGSIGGDSLAKIMNEHEVLVVPSVWAEPFGVVALEGIACGCAIVASNGGGLRDAVGTCGIVFENGKVESLCSALEAIVEREVCQQTAIDHLKDFQPSSIASRYLEILRSNR